MKHRVPVALVALALLVGQTGSALAKSPRVNWHDQDGSRVIVIDDDSKLQFLGDGAFLGVTLSDLDADEAGKDGGVRVQSVFDDTPAREAGLEAGDIILEFDGKKVTDAAALTALVREHDPGDKVKVKARRDGDSKTFRVTLAEREQSVTLDQLGRGPQRFFAMGDDDDSYDWVQGFGPGAARLGVEARDLDEDLGGYFPGAKHGALVLSVDEDSPAAKAGLKAGDVITKLGDDDVESVSDLRKAVGALAGEDAGTLVYVRKGKTERVDVEIPAAKAPFMIKRFSGDDAPFGQFHRMARPLNGGDEDLQNKLDALEKRLQDLEQRLKND